MSCRSQTNPHTSITVILSLRRKKQLYCSHLQFNKYIYTICKVNTTKEIVLILNMITCCNNKFSSQTELNETVVCNNEQIQVTIPSAFFLKKDPPVYVR